jgi:hypothetical protein
MNQFLKLRQALCRALGRLPNEMHEARQKAAGIIADIDDWNMWHEEGRLS